MHRNKIQYRAVQAGKIGKKLNFFLFEQLKLELRKKKIEKGGKTEAAKGEGNLGVGKIDLICEFRVER